MPGGVVRLQTLRGLAAQLFDSTLRTYIFRELMYIVASNVCMYRIYSLSLCKIVNIDLLKMQAAFWGGVEVA